MSGEYVIQTHVHFAAAHLLREYDGGCARMHGHNYKVEVQVTATQLDELGMGIDFREIRTAAKEVAKPLDHRFLNDIFPFTEENPTAENLARYFYDKLSDKLNQDYAWVSAVTVWETERAYVRYSRPKD